MIRRPITFPHCAPLTRRGAALLVQEASRYESRLMIEHDAKIVNAKSMLGLLSLGADAQSQLAAAGRGPRRGSRSGGHYQAAVLGRADGTVTNSRPERRAKAALRAEIFLLQRVKEEKYKKF